MHFYEYKGHIIYPTPRLQVESGYWKIQVTIRHNEDIKISSNDNIFATKGEAVFHCINYGKKLIDEGFDF